MFIVRWLTAHPILAAWALALFAILLNFGAGGSSDEEHTTEVAAAKHAEEGSSVAKQEVATAVESHQHANETAEQHVQVQAAVPAAAVEGAADHQIDAAVQALSGQEGTAAQAPAAQAPAAQAPAAQAPAAQAPAAQAPAAQAPAAQAPAAQAPAAQAPAAQAPAAQAPAAQAPAAQAPAAQAPAAQAPAAQAPAAQAPAAQAPAAQAPAAQAPAAQAPAAQAPAAQAPAAQAPAAQAPAAQAPAAQAPAAQAPMSEEELLRMAREAFWNKNYEKTVAHYQELIQQYPKPEYKGELGNVYYQKGKMQEAADLYVQVAIPLLEKGEIQQVANMLGFIGAFYPDKAQEISSLLSKQ